MKRATFLVARGADGGAVPAPAPGGKCGGELDGGVVVGRGGTGGVEAGAPDGERPPGAEIATGPVGGGVPGGTATVGLVKDRVGGGPCTGGGGAGCETPVGRGGTTWLPGSAAPPALGEAVVAGPPAFEAVPPVEAPGWVPGTQKRPLQRGQVAYSPAFLLGTDSDCLQRGQSILMGIAGSWRSYMDRPNVK